MRTDACLEYLLVARKLVLVSGSKIIFLGKNTYRRVPTGYSLFSLNFMKHFFHSWDISMSLFL